MRESGKNKRLRAIEISTYDDVTAMAFRHFRARAGISGFANRQNKISGVYSSNRPYRSQHLS